jgi:phosphoglycolate phosphatase-like HAD superfamily hydrolase
MDPARTWYVGDAESDVVIAGRAGFRFAGVAYNEQKRLLFSRLGIPEDQILSSIGELQVVIRLFSAEGM